MAGIYLDPVIKNLPYEKVFEDQACTLKGVSDWFEYKDGGKTNNILGKKFRLFYPELEKVLWVKVKNPTLKVEKLPDGGLAVRPVDLKVSMYGADKGGVEFSATAADIEPADEDLLG